ncbi:unnamed protein product [Rhizophagus irregularis]|nr:unnamed protein product [Rhizophagus irregularis]
MTKGGYGIIYKATWLRLNHNDNKTVILKRFENSKNNNKYFLNELRSNQQCFTYQYIINTYGFTKDPELEDYILVMEYASEGDLHKNISEGLAYIHNNEFIHRDFHSGNILLDIFKWKIGDLGLSQSVNNESSNNEIYGVIPYIAPEIFKGSTFSKEADIYSFGMIMWELTTEDTPECYANLMKSCWDPVPKKRPPIKEIHVTLCSWPLSALISKCLSTTSSSTISFGNNQDYNYNYISKEKDLDIDIESLSSQNLTIQNSSPSLKKRNNEELNLETYDNSVGKRIKTS